MAILLPEYTMTLHSNDLGITVIAPLPDTFAFDVSSQYQAPFAQGISVSDTVQNGLRLVGMSLTNQAMTAQVWQGTSDIQFTIPIVLQAEEDEGKEIVEPLKNLYRLTLPRVDQEGGLFRSPGPQLDLEKLAENSSAVTGFVSEGAKAQAASAGRLAGAVGGAMMGDNDEGLRSYAKSSKEARANMDTASSTASNVIHAATKNIISLKIGRFMKFSSVIVESVSVTGNVQPLASGVFQRIEASVSFRTFMIPTANELDTIFLFESGDITSEEQAYSDTPPI